MYIIMNRDGTQFYPGGAGTPNVLRRPGCCLVGADSVGGQMRGDKECRPISCVTTKLLLVYIIKSRVNEIQRLASCMQLLQSCGRRHDDNKARVERLKGPGRRLCNALRRTNGITSDRELRIRTRVSGAEQEHSLSYNGLLA